MKLTVALPAATYVLRIVATPTAEQITALQPMTAAIARSARCAQCARLYAALTIVRRCLQVDELHALGPDERRLVSDGGGATLFLSRQENEDKLRMKCS